MFKGRFLPDTCTTPEPLDDADGVVELDDELLVLVEVEGACRVCARTRVPSLRV